VNEANVTAKAVISVMRPTEGNAPSVCHGSGNSTFSVSVLA
jgi:hypothetical protein